MDNKILCVILARKGSKRCINKNTKPFADKSLTILAAQQADRLRFYFDEIIFSSNDEIAIDQVKSCSDHIKIRNRPEELCTSEASSESAIEDVLEYMKKTKGAVYSKIILLEVTSPLRIDTDIIESLKLAEETGRGVKSVALVKNCIEGEVINDKYQLEGSIHLWRTDWIRDTPYDRFNLLEIPAERAWHIDYSWEFDVAEMLYKRLVSTTPP